VAFVHCLVFQEHSMLKLGHFPIFIAACDAVESAGTEVENSCSNPAE
jgi:hypothetical protein